MPEVIKYAIDNNVLDIIKKTVRTVYTQVMYTSPDFWSISIIVPIHFNHG